MLVDVGLGADGKLVGIEGPPIRGPPIFIGPGKSIRHEQYRLMADTM